MFQLNHFAEQILQTLIHDQIDYGCVAPGSRSTPFAQALARQKEFKDFVHFDERSLGFHALGYARATKKCAPIFITSGSALANLFPAVVEAFQDQIPLLIFSADRPFELRDCSSNQTMDQIKFFHQYVLWHQDLPLFDKTLSSSFIPSVVRQALIKAQKGPVHLNCQFREPFFEMNKTKAVVSFENTFFPLASKVQKQLKAPPFFSYDQKGVILCGRKISQEEFLLIHSLAQKLNWPIFLDVLSFGRWGDFSHTLPLCELLLQAMPNLSFEVCVHFGGPIQSKVLLKWMSQTPFKEYHQVHEEEKILDPNRLPHYLHPLSPVDFCSQLLNHLSLETTSSICPLKNEHDQLKAQLKKSLNDFSEQSLVFHLIQSYRKERVFFTGASLPIRHLSQFCFSSFRHQVYSNRGVSGIDGNLSTAFGLSQGLDLPLTVLVGDLTFLYDLNALAQLRDLKHPIDLIVINNSGGGIFSYLPIQEDKKAHTRYFQTPHSFDLASISRSFGIKAYQPNTLKDFTSLLCEKSSFSRLIELKVEAQNSYQKQQQLLKECLACLSKPALQMAP